MNSTILTYDSRLLYSVICIFAIIGIIGNLFLLFIILHSKRLLDPTYMYIANIAASDLWTSMQTFVVNLFFAIKVTLKVEDWIIFCKVLSFLFFVSLITSSLTLLVVSLCRLRMVLEPTNFRSTSLLYKYRKVCMILIWIIGFSGAIPVYFLTNYQSIPPTCFTDYPYGQMFNVIFYLLSLIGGYLTPITIMMYSYIRIFRKLTLTSPTLLHTPSQSNVVSSNRSLKAIKFMLLVTCIYMMLILPFIIWMVGLSLVYQTQASLLKINPKMSLLFAIAFGTSYFVCILNPFLFLIFDKNIKSNLSRILLVITCH